MSLPLLQPAPAEPLDAPVSAPASVPRHVAIIMDGNGRWAAARRLPRVAGHRAGAQAVRRAIEAAIRARVQWLTLYAFSSENWRRPDDEVTDLTGLLRHYLRTEVAELHRERVRLRCIGDRGRFGPEIVRELAQAEALTSGNTRLNLTVALSYGGRSEIAAAARLIAEAAAAGRLDPASITEETFGQYLFTAGMPDPDLVIRTSGERRVSNFLLWQSAYAEFLFPEVLWPDFSQVHFDSALEDFSQRDRRYGGR
ncbi:MAG TPA: isoprenyl transferase [Acetobacteraceae bacterium]|nr:isoprenyl transferase [Acetobacteraceae bacterium]